MKRIQKQHQILILGGGYAGLMAAARAARSGDRASITLIDARQRFTQRIRLHEALAGGSPATTPYGSLLSRRGITFRQGYVRSIDTVGKRVHVADGEGRESVQGYDTLIIALGSTTAPSVPGVAEHAVRLDDPGAVARAAPLIAATASKGGALLVAGGGLTGIETATELAERYPELRVTLISRDSLDEGYAPAGSNHLRRRMGDLGIKVMEQREIVLLDERLASLRDGQTIPFDFCVWAGGFQPPGLGREAGLPVDHSGRILVGETLQVNSHPDIFVAGDAAAFDAPWGRVRMGCVSAMPMGTHAGENARRRVEQQPLEPFRFGIAVRCISLGRHDGLVQFTRPDDGPRERVWTGRTAVWVKELICRGTFMVPRWELKTGLRLYRWPEPRAGERSPGRQHKPGMSWRPQE